MELRELTSVEERSTFLGRVEQARAAGRVNFRASVEALETNRDRLAAARFFGLFRRPSDPLDAIVAGIAMHDLESFPQSCREPDLSRFIARTVVECSEHWSLSQGSGLMAWAALATPLRLMGVKAILAYLAAEDGESEHASFYATMGFKKVGPVAQHPFVETPDGEPLMVQPVLADGAALENGISAFADTCAGYSNDGRVFRLRPELRPLIRRAVQSPNVSRSWSPQGLPETPTMNAS